MPAPANVLVVANVTATSDELLLALKERAKQSAVVFTLLAPSSGAGLTARDAQQAIVDEVIKKWREAGLEADGVVWDSRPLVAVSEIWEGGNFDEVIVCTWPGKHSTWTQSDLPHHIARLTGVHTTHVIAHAPNSELPHGPPPVHEKPALGPLSVLSWGGPRKKNNNR
jgi:hypothetical protein